MPDAQQVARFAALLTAPAGAALADGSTDASGASDTPSSAESTALHRPPDPSRQAGRWDERQQDQPHDRDRDPPPAEPLPSPMALFSRAVEPAPAALSAPLVTPAPDLALLMHIERLAVGDDRIGQRRVRLTLADTLLPDTEVELGHEAGALQVSFFCHRSAGCQALQAQAPSLADQLATRLQQDVWLSVGDARRDDPGRLHVQARADRLRDTTP